MLEIPESKVIGRQAHQVLAGKTITDVINATTHHKFTWYNGDPLLYKDLLTGKKIERTNGHGMYVDLHCDGDVHISIGDGTNMQYHQDPGSYSGKHQLLIVFDDDSYLVFNVAMYGGIFAYQGELENPYYQGSLNSISPLSDDFDEPFFENILKITKPTLSVKAFLATEQRIPGLGNGVLQDILFNARIHPKRKIVTLSDSLKETLFRSVKTTLKEMTIQGGRDTEKDLFGRNGGYKTRLSKNTFHLPCPVCGSVIVKEAYLGGAVYYCPGCQKL